MHRRLYRNFGRTALIAASLVALSGCVQATRHSNTMVFGTNTTFGMKVGTATGETPAILVGYDRQEAVIMPLLANTIEHDGANGQDILSPCDPTRPIEVTGGQYAVHPCSFVAVKGGSLDSYSVLASFGAQFSAQATNPQASGGLAQYFATGLAAQILADRGGAALVSTSSPVAGTGTGAAGTAALFPNETSFVVGSGQAFDTSLITLRSHIRATTPSSLLPRKVRGLLDALMPALPPSIADGLISECTASADRCVTRVNGNNAVLLDSDNFDEAVAGWAAY